MSDVSRRSFVKLGATAAAGASVLAAGAAVADEKADAPVAEDWLGAAPELSVADCVDTVETEVLIVGAALAGSMAAYGAVRNGAQVTIIERNASPHIGGMTMSFLNSKTQLDAGLPEYNKVKVANDMFNLTQYRSDMKLNAIWCNRSGEVLDNMVEDFLEPYGQYYKPVSLEGIFPDPSQEITAYISCGVEFSESTDILTDFTHNIQKFLADKGVRTDFEMRGEVLVKGDAGKVEGVIATNAAGEHVYYHASKGVIMCTGSYGGNDTMMRHFFPKSMADFAARTRSYNVYMLDDPITDYNGDDGLGHRMLCWAGAQMEDIPSYLAWQTTAWRSFPYLLVDQQGRRFMNEATSLLTSGHIVAELPGETDYVWQIIPTNDFEMASSFGYNKENAAKVFNIEMTENYQADTIEELAEMIGVDPETLSATVARYNELCEAGEDVDYMKAARYLDPIDDGPYQAWKMNYNFFCTLSGVRCNEKLEVLDENHDPIPGLYAAGNTVGWRFGSSYETLLHGGSNGLAAVHGYLAGESAALA